MMEFFCLKTKDIVFYTMEEGSNILTARIYGEDGIEIDYLTRPLGLQNSLEGDWILHIDWPSDDGNSCIKQIKNNRNVYIISLFR